ncbi:MAG: type II toxin-antitoxin system RatA family toxin [Rhodobiaceae bacterium]|nr:type II toxin-antitoxin system RatA family toxin [Rhodobiaceae bacterium]
MKRYRTTRRVRQNADDMFALVADVERYPEFVPLCAAMSVLSREPLENGGEEITARMTAAYKAVSETFTSRVVTDPDANVITVEYLDGPFQHLENRWSFKPLGERRCEVDFFIAYQFRSRALELLMGAMFDRAFRKFAEAFEARANALYGMHRARG